MKNYYVVYSQGSYLEDLNLRQSTVNGRYWASYIPIDEIKNVKIDVWCTDNLVYAQAIAMLVDGSVRVLEEGM